MERQAQDATEQLSIGLRALTDWANGFIVLLPNMIIAAIMFAVFYFIARGVRSVVRRMTRDRQTADVGLVLGRLAQWTIVLLGLLVAVTIVAPSVKPVDLLSLLGIGGVAIGFAFKDILQNFLAGILILLRHPFRVGDQVIFASYEGTVETIDTRSTHIRTYDGRLVVVPNGEIYTKSIIVNTAYGQRRSEYDVGIGSGADIREAARIILEALHGAAGVLPDPAPDVIAMELADWSVKMRARWWTRAEIAEVLRVRHEVIATLKERLDAAHIDLPFPTRVVLLHDGTEEVDGDRTRQRQGEPADAGPGGTSATGARPGWLRHSSDR